MGRRLESFVRRRSPAGERRRSQGESSHRSRVLWATPPRFGGCVGSCPNLKLSVCLSCPHARVYTREAARAAAASAISANVSRKGRIAECRALALRTRRRPSLAFGCSGRLGRHQRRQDTTQKAARFPVKLRHALPSPNQGPCAVQDGHMRHVGSVRRVPLRPQVPVRARQGRIAHEDS